MSLHITPHTKGLATTHMSTFEWLLTGVTMAMDLQTAGSGKCLLASDADVAFLHAREARLRGCADVVVVLPLVDAGYGTACAHDWGALGHALRERHEVWWEARGQRSLVVEAIGGIDTAVGAVVGAG